MTVFVGPSIWRDINVVTSTRLFVAMASSPESEKVIWAPLWNDALIGRSRSLMCTEFLNTAADVMVIIDDDIVFETADFWKIVEGARETRGIYGGAYVTRSVAPHLTSRTWPGQQIDFRAGPVRKPVDIQYLATGFFAFHRDVLERMVDHRFEDADGSHLMAECQLGADRPFVPFFSPFVCLEADGRRHYLSEDWAFCNRARQVGATVHMDTSIILQHLGIYPYTVADIGNPGNAFPSKGIERAEVESRRRWTGEQLVDSLVDDIAEWDEADVGDVRRIVEESDGAVTSRLFLERPDGQTEAEWYEREDVGSAYIAELANWHLGGFGAWPRLADLDLAGKTVLDFGAGIATWSLVAAREGAGVSVYEPNPVMRELAMWRAQKHGISVEFIDGERPLRPESYDVIVAWHVFEHLEDPDGTLRHLLTLLKPGAVLITESGFDDHGQAQHHAHPDWEGALVSAGLVQTGPFTWTVAPREDAGALAAELAGVV